MAEYRIESNTAGNDDLAFEPRELKFEDRFIDRLLTNIMFYTAAFELRVREGEKWTVIERRDNRVWDADGKDCGCGYMDRKHATYLLKWVQHEVRRDLESRDNHGLAAEIPQATG